MKEQSWTAVRGSQTGVSGFESSEGGLGMVSPRRLCEAALAASGSCRAGL
jgi:hypothetical protein